MLWTTVLSQRVRRQSSSPKNVRWDYNLGNGAGGRCADQGVVLSRRQFRAGIQGGAQPVETPTAEPSAPPPAESEHAPAVVRNNSVRPDSVPSSDDAGVRSCH
jgi:hypothetical protein